MVCNIRCQMAKNPKCVCSCHGEKHGTKRQELDKNIGEKYLSTAMGGEVEELIKKLYGKEFKCYLGRDGCKETIKITEFLGYPHEGGLADKDGKKWWVFIRCPHCEYDYSWSKVENKLQQGVLHQNPL